MKQSLTLLSILLFFALLWTVSAQEATEAPVDLTDPALIERGQTLFTSFACTACHGQNAEGTDLAPALAGHSEFAVRRQLRAPIGIMPPFNPIALPASDLDAIVAYVLSLEATEADHAHDHAIGLALGDFVFAHHWLLWLALQEDNAALALEQIEHLSPYIEGGHLVQIEMLADYINEGDFEAARDFEETMIADVNVFGEDADYVYLQMIYRSIVAEDAIVAQHFISDYLAHMQSHETMGLITELQAALETSDYVTAIALMEAEYGDSLLFEAHVHDDSHPHGEATEEASHAGHGEATAAPTEEGEGEHSNH